MLDLAGYMADRDLTKLRIVEPAVGDGVFVLAIVERLIESCRRFGRHIAETANAIAGYEIDHESCRRCRESVIRLLVEGGSTQETAADLAERWIQVSDFLLDRQESLLADIVIGNPPYIRLEDIPDELVSRYRSRYPTMTGRADLYIAFFEASLRLLSPGGVCSFICADRWMLNQYGTQLRRLITSRFAVETVIELHNANAFESEVSAYPAITVIRRAS
jgi:type I restriction-modification system DNA methylase subunit